MKALETQYRGFEFRSRLEAKYAVFFDCLKIDWQYEVEGFDLVGDYYLPDFWLTDLQMYVEVKGQRPDDDAIRKCRKLQFFTEQDVLLCYDLPTKHYGQLFSWSNENGGQFTERFVEWQDLDVAAMYIEEAALVAKQARFEHGEYPNSRLLKNTVDYDNIAF